MRYRVKMSIAFAAVVAFRCSLGNTESSPSVDIEQSTENAAKAIQEIKKDMEAESLPDNRSNGHGPEILQSLVDRSGTQIEYTMYTF